MWAAPNFEVGLSAIPAGRDENLPQIRLWAAVFALGVQDWLDEQTGRLDYKKSGLAPSEPTQWVSCGQLAPGSFVWCCEALGYAPSRARALMQAELDKRCLLAHQKVQSEKVDTAVATTIIRTVAGQSDNQPGARK